MTFLPIVERELRVAARRRGTYWVRVGAALTGLAIGCWIMLMPSLRSPKTLGIALFVALSVVALMYSLLAGLRTTADCLSEEKREGTLGLLFLTDLKGYDIVLGKLAATSLHAFYGMLALFPVMAISLLLGGVTGGEFWRMVLVCVNNLFFSLAVGMFCSAVSRDGWKSAVLALGLLLFFTGVLPVTGILLTEWKRLPVAHPVFFIPSPGYASFMAFDESSKAFAKFNFFYWSVLCVHLLGWGFLLAACFAVPRTWQDKAARQPRFRWFGAPAASPMARRGPLEHNPFYWLASRNPRKAVLVWGFLGVMSLGWLWGIGTYQQDWLSKGVYVFTALVCHSVLKWWVAAEATRRFVEDRQSGALEQLLSTPLTVRQVLGGQLLALGKQFAGPVGVVLAADGLFLYSDRSDGEWVMICVAGISMFIADLIALAWVGMWMGLTSRNINRAVSAAVVRVLVLPWLLYGMLVTVLELTDFFRHVPLDSWWRHYWPILAWMLIGFFLNAVFAFDARRRLLHRFRNVTTQRFEVRPARFRKSKA